VITGFKRSKSNTYPSCTLLKIDGVRTKEDTKFYHGKRVAYVYKAKREVKNSKYRVLWGKVRRAHGNSGMVRAKFQKNMPPRAFGAPCRIMLSKTVVALALLEEVAAFQAPVVRARQVQKFSEGYID